MDQTIKKKRTESKTGGRERKNDEKKSEIVQEYWL